VIIALIGAIVTGCGLPDDSATRTVPRDEVPYRLLDPRPTASPAPPSATGIVATPQVYFVDRNDQLVPQAQPVTVSGLREVVEALLAALTAGPSPGQRQRGLATALGPNAAVNLLEVHEGLARIAITPGEPGPDADRLPLAVGQVVLTTASVVGVDRVAFVQDGRALAVPLPGGEQASDPVTAQDYVALISESARSGGSGANDP